MIEINTVFLQNKFSMEVFLEPTKKHFHPFLFHVHNTFYNEYSSKQ